MPSSLPLDAQVVVIGGGVVGASVAYHLAHLGCRDVLLLERSKIGSGTSWHAAGNMETYRADPLIGEMVAYAVDLYPRLEKETGQALGWRQSGRVMFTREPERMAGYRGLPALGKVRGIEIELLTPKGVAERLPFVETKDLAGGAWVPNDGRINPTDLAMAFAKGARMKGATVIEDTAVTGLRARDGRIHAVDTARGTVRCETAVIAAGLWSPVIGGTAGVAVPLHAVQHFYILTKPLACVTRDTPLFISYDELIYGREDVGGLLVGFFDRNAIPVRPDELPKEFSFSLLPSNWDQVEPNMAIALARMPVLKEAEIRLLLNGPESFTPDMQMLLGESPGLGGCFLATGMNSNGIALSACAGRLTAEWIVHGRPSLDATRLDVRRFGHAQAGRSFLRDRASEVIIHMCRLPAPDLDFENTRRLRCSPLHGELEAAGARFKSVAGWERPIWYVPQGRRAEDWPAFVAEETAAAESGAALADLSSHSKLLLEGPGAEATLHRLSGAMRPLADGEALQAPMLNPMGGVEVLATVWRLSGSQWLILADPEQAIRPEAWITKHCDPAQVRLTDVSAAWCLLALLGPGGAALVDAAATLRDQHGSAAEIGHVPVLVQRGQQPDALMVLVSAEQAIGVFRRLREAGRAAGVRLIGSLAAEAMAVKHAVRRFGAEVTPFVSAVGAGLAGALDADGNREFIGRDAVLKERSTAPAKVVQDYVCKVPGPGLFARAPVLAEAREVGHVTSSARVPSLGKVAMLALVDHAARSSALRVLVDGVAYDLEPGSAALAAPRTKLKGPAAKPSAPRRTRKTRS